MPVPTRVSANTQTWGKAPVFEILLLCFPSKHFVFLSPLHHPRHGSNACCRLQISPCARLQGVITPAAALGKKLPMKLLSQAPAPARGCLHPGCHVPLAARCPWRHQPLHHRPGTGCPVPHICGQSWWVPPKQVGQALGLPHLCCGVGCHRDPPPLRSCLPATTASGAAGLSTWLHRLERYFLGGSQFPSLSSSRHCFLAGELLIRFKIIN